MKRKILITGGAGFIASCIADKLIEDPDNYVVIVDNLLTGTTKNVPLADNCKFIKGDVNEYDSIANIMTTYKFNYVFHYAAVVGVKRTLDNPVMVLHDIEGIKNILNLAKNTGVDRVFYSSSSEVYGEPVELPQNEETTPLNSRLPYAIVKNIGEAFCKSYQQEFGLDYTIFRFFNTFGPKQSIDFVMSKFLTAALTNSDITIYGDGSQTRTFCYVNDNVEATVNALYNNLGVNEVLNLGNDHEISIKQLAELILQLTGSSSKIVYLPPLPEGDMTRRQPDIGKMRTLLSREMTPIEVGITHILESGRMLLPSYV